MSNTTFDNDTAAVSTDFNWTEYCSAAVVATTSNASIDENDDTSAMMIQRAICTIQDSLSTVLLNNSTDASSSSPSSDGSSSSAVPFFLLIAGAMIFVMQIGFAMRSASVSSHETMPNVLMNHFLGICAGAIAFFFVGYAVAYGGRRDDSDSGKSFAGNGNWALRNLVDRDGSDQDDTMSSNNMNEYVVFFVQFVQAMTAATIVTGVIADRCKVSGYILYVLFFCAFAYPVIAHSIWDNYGFLSPLTMPLEDRFKSVGMIDIAGSGVIHMTGGLTALMATMIMGPRNGRFYNERGTLLEEPGEFPFHSLALQLLGSTLVWFGWYGLNPGSAVLWHTSTTGYTVHVPALVFVTTTMSAAAGCLSCTFLGSVIGSATTGAPTYDVTKSTNGALAGLVAISAGCAIVEPWVAIIIGFLAGIFYYVGSNLLIKFHIDDPVDAIPVHLINGIWGVLAVGLFAKGTFMNDLGLNGERQGVLYALADGALDINLLLAQVTGMAWIVGWIVVVMTIYLLIFMKLGMLRLLTLEEIEAAKHADDDDNEDEQQDNDNDDDDDDDDDDSDERGDEERAKKSKDDDIAVA